MAPSTEDTSYRLVNSEVRDLTPEELVSEI